MVEQICSQKVGVTIRLAVALLVVAGAWAPAVALADGDETALSSTFARHRGDKEEKSWWSTASGEALGYVGRKHSRQRYRPHYIYYDAAGAVQAHGVQPWRFSLLFKRSRELQVLDDDQQALAYIKNISTDQAGQHYRLFAADDRPIADVSVDQEHRAEFRGPNQALLATAHCTLLGDDHGHWQVEVFHQAALPQAAWPIVINYVLHQAEDAARAEKRARLAREQAEERERQQAAERAREEERRAQERRREARARMPWNDYRHEFTQHLNNTQNGDYPNLDDLVAWTAEVIGRGERDHRRHAEQAQRAAQRLQESVLSQRRLQVLLEEAARERARLEAEVERLTAEVARLTGREPAAQPEPPQQGGNGAVPARAQRQQPPAPAAAVFAGAPSRTKCPVTTAP